MDKMIIPLSNGVAIYDKNRLCVSTIDENGDKNINGENIKETNKIFDKPIIRGITYFFFGFNLYYRCFVLQRQEKEEGKNKSAKSTDRINFLSDYIMLIASIVISFFVGYLLLGVLPSYIFNSIFTISTNYYFQSFMIALFRILIFYAVMVILRFCPFMSGLYSFNGVGNIWQNGEKGSYRYRICPLNFLNFIVIVSILSLFVISLIAININFIINFFINLLLIFVIISLSYELLRFVSNTKLLWLKDLSLVTNFLVCGKPNITQEEVIMSAKLELENFKDFEKTDKNRISISTLYAEMQTKLKNSERFEQSDVDWIIATVLNKSRAEAKLVRSVSQKEYREIMRACEKRAKGEPISSIFGFVEFYGLRLDVNKKVLSPRMETELLVDEALKKIREYELESVLDMCTGSGAIAIAVAKYYPCKVTAVDVSKGALGVAQINAQNNNVKVEFIQSDLFKGLKKNKKYDIIISNPPYIKSGDIEKLDVEVKKFDPRLALDGGVDGLNFYREIIASSGKHLTKNGWLFFEVGQGQAQKVKEMMTEQQFYDVNIIKDYSKIERIVYGRAGKGNIRKNFKDKE